MTDETNSFCQQIFQAVAIQTLMSPAPNQTLLTIAATGDRIIQSHYESQASMESGVGVELSRCVHLSLDILNILLVILNFHFVNHKSVLSKIPFFYIISYWTVLWFHLQHPLTSSLSFEVESMYVYLNMFKNWFLLFQHKTGLDNLTSLKQVLCSPPQAARPHFLLTISHYLYHLQSCDLPLAAVKMVTLTNFFKIQRRGKHKLLNCEKMKSVSKAIL